MLASILIRGHLENVDQRGGFYDYASDAITKKW